MLRITPTQQAALAARRAVERMAEELPLHEPSLLDWPQAAVEALAKDAYERALAWGLTRLPDHLFFALTMLRVHPRFDEVPAIRRVLQAMQADGTLPADKVARLVDETDDEAWDAAGAKGGYDAYFAELMEGAAHG